MTLLTNSTPADVQRKIDVEDLCHQLLERIGMEEYSAALNFCGSSGHGRIRAIQWQVIHAHLLLRRRGMCGRAQQNFHEVEFKASKAVKKLWPHLDELSWLLVYIYTAKILVPDEQPEIWDYARATLSTWSTSS